jgi:type I restriction enzyme S subunit
MSALPNSWIKMPLSEVGNWFGGGTPSKSNPRFWTGGKIPWVSPKDMKRDLIIDAEDHIPLPWRSGPRRVYKYKSQDY